MNICVCDDDLQTCNVVKELLCNISFHGEPHTIDCFLSGEEVLQKYKDGVCYDLIFLDVEMPGLDGLETGEQIRRMDSRVHIVLLTLHEKYALDAYNIHPFAYLLKPADQERLNTICSNVFAELEKKQTEYFRFDPQNTQMRIAYTDIIFLERYKMGLWIHAHGREIRGLISLDAALSALDDRFLQVHNNYAVNLDYYDEIIGRYEGMRLRSCSRVVPIGKNKKKHVVKGLMQYVETHG